MEFMDSVNPDVKRAVLTQKLRSLRAQGYEHEVNAEIGEALGDEDTVVQSRRLSRQAFVAARRVESLLNELPDPQENGDGDNETR